MLSSGILQFFIALIESSWSLQGLSLPMTMRSAPCFWIITVNRSVDNGAPSRGAEVVEKAVSKYTSRPMMRSITWSQHPQPPICARTMRDGLISSSILHMCTGRDCSSPGKPMSYPACVMVTKPYSSAQSMMRKNRISSIATPWYTGWILIPLQPCSARNWMISR